MSDKRQCNDGSSYVACIMHGVYAICSLRDERLQMEIADSMLKLGLESGEREDAKVRQPEKYLNIRKRPCDKIHLCTCCRTVSPAAAPDEPCAQNLPLWPP